MGLLHEIQNDAVDQASTTSSLLRKCLLLASRIESLLLEDWVRHELNGYPESEEVPDYRRLSMNFKGNFVASFGRQITNAPIPQHIVGKVSKRPNIEIYQFRGAISTLDDRRGMSESGALRVNYDNMAMFLHDKVFEDYQCLQFWGEISAMAALAIPDIVKTRVLDFTLKLAKTYPTAGDVAGMTTTDRGMKENLSQIFNTTINGQANLVGVAEKSTISIVNGAGSVAELRNALSEAKIEPGDLDEIERAIAEEKQIVAPGKFGPKVTAWIGKMAGKAASGAWGVGLAAGTKLVESALLRFYGFTP
ncbi:hypothetical protein AB9E28_18530 [Rhizobium leguminosarum]|uniref:AbiTii domain-containing protein n=1 Tax=Rhizobium leguminosarum TaxID=384 RepID=UPI003F9EA0E9